MLATINHSALTSKPYEKPVAAETGGSEQKFECVFVNDNGKAKLKVVTTGIQDDTNIEIISGLSENDEIITGPYNTVSKTLKSGDAIEVTNKNGADGSKKSVEE